MLHVREPHLLQTAGAAPGTRSCPYGSTWPARPAPAAVLEVDLLERFGGDLLELGVAGPLLLGIEEAGGVDGRQGTVRCRMRSWSVDPIGAV
ncbi:hypothetical protein ADL30_20410 [Streptomyces sp. NRRL S-1521]|nr:hypothetical protein ADL30_20410 [Streptomyces sp. NRRL S-1521]